MTGVQTCALPISGASPTELMFGRRVRTVFDLLQPSYKVQKKVQAQTSKMQNRSKGTRSRHKVSYEPEDKVLLRMYSKGSSKWEHAVIERRTGAVTYQCSLPNGTILHRHVNQLWLDKSKPSVPNHENLDELPFSNEDQVEDNSDTISVHSFSSDSSQVSGGVDQSESSSVCSEAESTVSVPSVPAHARSGILVKPPDRLDLYVIIHYYS